MKWEELMDTHIARYAYPVCKSVIEIDLEAGEEMPGYRKHRETEFDEPTQTRYKLLKLVDGEWYAEGNYDTPEALATAAHCLGALGYEQVKVERVV